MKESDKADLSQNNNNSALPEVEDALKATLKQVQDNAAKMIEDGLSKPTASTGTPIDKLHGLPKIIAQTSNIGGGSLETGGGGFAEGDRIKKIHNAAEVAIKTLDLLNQQNKSQNDSTLKLEENSIPESE